MEECGRILGLDVGDVRTGVAVTDPMRIIAQAKEVIQNTTMDKDVEAISKIVEETGAVGIVVGLPLNQKGEVGPQAEKVLAFIESLKKAVSVEIVTQDERFSTVAAERMLIEAKVRRKGRKKVIDKVAAQQILQAWMDGQAAAQRRARELRD